MQQNERYCFKGIAAARVWHWFAVAGFASLLCLGAGPHPAYAQNMLSQHQCREAKAVVLATLKRHRVSEPLAQSFVRFSEACDMGTKFNTVPGTADDQAFGEFRLKIAAIRTRS